MFFSRCLYRTVQVAACVLGAQAFGGDKPGPEEKEKPRVPAPETQQAKSPASQSEYPASQQARSSNQAQPKAPAKGEEPDLPRAPLADGVFMQSGDIKITVAGVDKILLLMLTDEKKRNPRAQPSQERMLESKLRVSEILLQNAVIEKYARDNNLATPEDELNKFIDVKKMEQKRDGSSFEQMLVDTGWTEAEFRAFWSARLAIEKSAASKVTDAEVDDYFNKTKDTIPLRSAAHVLFQYKGADSAPKDLKRTKEEARAAAEQALKEAKAGADFAKLAEKSDDDATKANGGSLPFFPLKGQDAMVDSFGKAAYALPKIGDLTPVVETPYGFHIIKLTGTKDVETKNDVRRYLGLKKFDELMRPILIKAAEAAQFNEKLVPPPGDRGYDPAKATK